MQQDLFAAVVNRNGIKRCCTIIVEQYLANPILTEISLGRKAVILAHVHYLRKHILFYATEPDQSVKNYAARRVKLKKHEAYRTRKLAGRELPADNDR